MLLQNSKHDDEIVKVREGWTMLSDAQQVLCLFDAKTIAQKAEERKFQTFNLFLRSHNVLELQLM